MSFIDHSAKSKLSDKRLLKSFIQKQILSATHKKSKLTYIFMSDDDLLKMNQSYLQHDTYTDIITFDLSEDSSLIIGEIYISIDRVQENSERFGISYEEELLRVIFHGALHLCGYSDKTKAQKEKMRALENQWIKAYRRWRK